MAGTGGNTAGFFNTTRFIHMSLYREFCHDKQNYHGSTNTLQPHLSLSKTECYQLGSREKIQKNKLQHQTQVLQHHTQNSGKKGNILGINLLMQVDYSEGKV
jgi:hypothetical protein